MNKYLKISIQILLVNFLALWIVVFYLQARRAKELPKQEPGVTSAQSTAVEVENSEGVSLPTQTTTEALGKITSAPTVTPSPINPLPSAELSSHNTPTDCWIMVSDKIYNITSYFGKHPGGDAIMAKYCGKDATVAYNTKEKTPGKPHSAKANSLLNQYLIR
ncbi:MAG: cytochrome b5-like heme/steroid binding domain-containing protein [Candidatus Jordarchaeaceae archaeon]